MFSYVEKEIIKAFQKFKPKKRETLIEWLENNVVVPQVVNSPYPGRLNLSRTPYLKAFLELYENPRIEQITLCKSARVGGTLFSLLLLLYKIAKEPGPVLWVDPTKDLGLRVSQQEIQPFIEACKPVYSKAYRGDREKWKTLEMMFKDCTLGIIGAQSPAALGGRQAELLILNERAKFKESLRDEAPPAQLAIDRTKQFADTRKIIQNSTPTTEENDIWRDFMEGTRNYIYVPCPCCNKYQRLTFFSEEAEVPFDDDLQPLPEGEKRMEKTGRFNYIHCKNKATNTYNLDKVYEDTRYECAYCKELIPYIKINWMLSRLKCVAHNPEAFKSKKASCHIWAAYSPFEKWGVIAANFIHAQGNEGRLHNFYNSDLGVPFIREASTLKNSDIDKIILKSPEYMMRMLPRKPAIMPSGEAAIAMTVDVQGDCFWWSIRAYGIVEDSEDLEIWSALIDCGKALTWNQIEEIAGIIPDKDGNYNKYRFGDEDFQVSSGYVDSGYNAQKDRNVYEFCNKHYGFFYPSKGSSNQILRGKGVQEYDVGNDRYPDLRLVMYPDEQYKQALYNGRVKNSDVKWWVPFDVSDDWREQMVSEYIVKKKKPNGTFEIKWHVRNPPGNHLADTEKMQIVLYEQMIEAYIKEIRDDIIAKREVKAS